MARIATAVALVFAAVLPAGGHGSLGTRAGEAVIARRLP